MPDTQELTSENEARRTLSWINGKVATAGHFERDWQRMRSRMEHVNTGGRISQALPIEHDFWICKRANPLPRPDDYLVPFASDYQSWSEQIWQPPQEWNQWPTFGVESEDWLTSREAR